MRLCDPSRAARHACPLPALLFVAVSFLGCGEGPTAEDEVRLEELERSHGHRYRFRFASTDIYLEATRTAAGAVHEAEARRIFRDFWFTDGAPRTDTRYVYLNLYDSRGDFQFQLSWDAERQAFVRSAASHY